MSSKAGTRRVELEGGATLLLEESHLVPLVAITVALRTGALYDPEGREGLYRYAGRMLRRGAGALSSSDIEDAIDRLGSEIGVDAASSSFSFGGQVIRRSLDPFVELAGTLLASPTFSEDEAAKLRRESVAELVEARDNDRSLAQRAFRRAMFPNHGYGRFASGTPESVAAITASEARALHGQHFRQKNAIVTFSGDVDEATAVAAATRLLRGLPAGEPTLIETPEPPKVAGRRLVFVDKPERTQTQILIGTLGTSATDPDHVPLLIANAVFGGTFTSRLMREVRSKRGWSYGASSRLGIDRRRQSFSMWTFPAATDAAACIALELELFEAFVKDGITARELGFIKKYLTRSYAFEIDTPHKRVHQALDVDLYGLPADYYSSHTAHVDAVTVDAAREAVQRRLDPESLLFVVVGTAKDILKPIQDAIPRLSETTVVPFDTL